MAGFTVVDCSTVVATHLSHLMQLHAAKLLGRVETQQLVEHVDQAGPETHGRRRFPRWSASPRCRRCCSCCSKKACTSATCARSSSAWPSIAATVTDPAELARRIRIHLAPSIVQQIYGPTQRARGHRPRARARARWSPRRSIRRTAPRSTRASPTRCASSAAESAKRQEDLGHPACLLVPDLIRAPMARLLKRAAPRLKVLSHSEIPETHSIRIGSIIGAAA